MKAILFILISFVILCRQTEQKELSLQEVAQLQEDEIDIGTICLLLAKDAYPNINIERFEECLDFMVERIQLLSSEYPNDPETCIGLLNTYLFIHGWWNDSIIFEYDIDDLQAKKIENRYLNGIISTKKDHV